MVGLLFAVLKSTEAQSVVRLYLEQLLYSSIESLLFCQCYPIIATATFNAMIDSVGLLIVSLGMNGDVPSAIYLLLVNFTRSYNY